MEEGGREGGRKGGRKGGSEGGRKVRVKVSGTGLVLSYLSHFDSSRRDPANSRRSFTNVRRLPVCGLCLTVEIHMCIYVYVCVCVGGGRRWSMVSGNKTNRDWAHLMPLPVVQLPLQVAYPPR